MSPQKQVTDVSLVLKDSDRESEKLSSLIKLSASDGQNIDSSKDVSFLGTVYSRYLEFQGTGQNMSSYQ